MACDIAPPEAQFGTVGQNQHVLLVIVAVGVTLAVGSVFLLAYFSSERTARPDESRWRAFRNGLRRRHRTGPVEVSLAEMLQVAEPDETTPFAAFDQVRQRAVERAARAAGLAAALVAREPSAPEQQPEREHEPEQDQTPADPFSDLSFSELEIARAELALAELTLAKLTLAGPVMTSGPDVPHDTEPDPQDEAEPTERERARTT